LVSPTQRRGTSPRCSATMLNGIARPSSREGIGDRQWRWHPSVGSINRGGSYGRRGATVSRLISGAEMLVDPHPRWTDGERGRRSVAISGHCGGWLSIANRRPLIAVSLRPAIMYRRGRSHERGKTRSKHSKCCHRNCHPDSLCCTDQHPGAVSPSQRYLREANVLRPPKLEHPV